MKQTVIIEIPEGYEAYDTQGELYFTDKSTGQVYVNIKKQTVKDFDWYVDEYLGSVSMCYQLKNWITDNDLAVAASRLKTKQFSLVPWEIKIGLCAFICKEIGIPWSEYIHQFNGTVYTDEILSVNNILPESFRDTLINH